MKNSRSDLGKIRLYSPVIYPARFPESVLYGELREGVCSAGDGVVFDPFAGSGVVGVIASICGRESELWDINPVTLVNVDAWIKVLRYGESVVEEALAMIEDALSSGPCCEYPEGVEGWWSSEVLPVVGRVWGYFRERLARPAGGGFEAREKAWSVYAALAMYASRRLSFSDDNIPKYYRSRLKRERLGAMLASGKAEELFLELARQRAERILRMNLTNAQPRVDPRVRVVDSVTFGGYPGRIGVVVTSPPYLQAQEYIRSFRYDLLWLGFDAETVRRLRGLEVPYRRVPPREIESRAFWRLLRKVGKKRLRSLAVNYFSSVVAVLEKCAERLVPGGRMYVFVGDSTLGGVEVNIAGILSEHLAARGLVLLKEVADPVRKARVFRGARRNANPNGIKVERLVVLEKP